MFSHSHIVVLVKMYWIYYISGSSILVLWYNGIGQNISCTIRKCSKDTTLQFFFVILFLCDRNDFSHKFEEKSPGTGYKSIKVFGWLFWRYTYWFDLIFSFKIVHYSPLISKIHVTKKPLKSDLVKHLNNFDTIWLFRFKKSHKNEIQTNNVPTLTILIPQYFTLKLIHYHISKTWSNVFASDTIGLPYYLSQTNTHLHYCFYFSAPSECVCKHLRITYVHSIAFPFYYIIGNVH